MFIQRLSYLVLAASFLLPPMSAFAQWPTDTLLDRLPRTQDSVAASSPQSAPNTIVELPEPPALEELPVTDELTSESWILPNYWLNFIDWEGSLEVGINGTSGNSESTSFIISAKLKRKTEQYDTTFDFNYVNTTANSLETQNNAIQNYRYERKFGDSRWTFLRESIWSMTSLSPST